MSRIVVALLGWDPLAAPVAPGAHRPQPGPAAVLDHRAAPQGHADQPAPVLSRTFRSRTAQARPRTLRAGRTQPDRARHCMVCVRKSGIRRIVRIDREDMLRKLVSRPAGDPADAPLSRAGRRHAHGDLLRLRQHLRPPAGCGDRPLAVPRSQPFRRPVAASPRRKHSRASIKAMKSRALLLSAGHGQRPERVGVRTVLAYRPPRWPPCRASPSLAERWWCLRDAHAARR